MARLTVWLMNGEKVSLERTDFTHPLLPVSQRTVRGKTSGAFSGYSTFQWTPAVQAAMILMFRTIASVHKGTPYYSLEGTRGSAASCLDYSIGKLPEWVLNVFGTDGSGMPLAKRMFTRTNPEQKRPGPVAVALNQNFIAADEIAVMLDGCSVTDAAELSMLADRIEADFHSSRARTDRAAAC